jgi:hypothetical protein
MHYRVRATTANLMTSAAAAKKREQKGIFFFFLEPFLRQIKLRMSATAAMFE